MKINRVWIEYTDQHGDSYMVPVTEADIIAWLSEKAKTRKINTEVKHVS